MTKTAPDRLVRHLGIALALKLALLLALWWGFVRDFQVAVDEAQVAAHVRSGPGAASHARPASTVSNGAQP